MSKKIYLFSLVLLALAFTACSETEETCKYDNWQARNEAFIDSIANAHANTATRGQLDSIHMIAYPGVPIYFKKKTPVGDGVIQNIIPRATACSRSDDDFNAHGAFDRTFQRHWNSDSDSKWTRTGSHVFHLGWCDSGFCAESDRDS